MGTRSIALVSLAAVLTLRGMPSVAEYGWSSIAYYVLGAVLFLIPLAMVAAELASAYPKAGGLYAWVKEAFNQRSGFMAIWFEWIEDQVWFPTVLSFVAASAAYVFDPSLANHKGYLVIVMLSVFWGLTLANFLGMRWTLRLNNPGVIIGTLFPAVVLIGIGIYWLIAGKHNAIPFHASKLVPSFSSINNLVFFVGVVLGYAGIELAGFHAKETKNPKRDFPRALLMATALIVGMSIIVTLAIAFVVPRHELSLVSGILQTYSAAFASLGIGSWATKLMAGLVTIGTLALISTWLLGPNKGMYATETTGELPPALHKVNKRHVPVALLVCQGVLTSVFALAFLFVPSINTSYWMLTALTTQILVLMYGMIMAAAIRLRYTQPDVERPYKIPGGIRGMWLVAGAGIVGCVFSFVIGFIPPSGVSHWPTPIYIAAMAAAIIICSLPPFIVERIKKPSWVEAHPDPVLLELDDEDAGAESGITTADADTTAPRGEPLRRRPRTRSDEHTSTPGSAGKVS
ncbi:MAG TPA: amino acid permease [Solirubrobacteraceae bacterium]|nr:amino acid permease [Solirubrobacteraceae bacterium]